MGKKAPFSQQVLQAGIKARSHHLNLSPSLNEGAHLPGCNLPRPDKEDPASAHIKGYRQPLNHAGSSAQISPSRTSTEYTGRR